MKVQAIKTSDGYFVTNPEKKRYNNELVTTTFGRIKLEPTWKQEWYKIPDVYAKAEKHIPATNVTVGYKLMDAYVPTEALPAEVPKDYFTDYDDPHRSLYTPILEEVPESYEDVEVEIEEVAELEGKLVHEKLFFPVYGQYPNSEGKSWTVTNDRIKLGLVDDLITPNILKDERPCELPSAESFAIIRTHIKDNIDPKVAVITSDYNFCLTVEKRIPLAVQEQYKVDENFSLFSRRKRKLKFVTKYRNERRKEVYEIAPRLDGKVYSDYPEAPIFRGENTRNLKANIETYLKELMKEINRPLHDCPYCKGEGVVEKS